MKRFVEINGEHPGPLKVNRFPSEEGTNVCVGIIYLCVVFTFKNKYT